MKGGKGLSVGMECVRWVQENHPEMEGSAGVWNGEVSG